MDEHNGGYIMMEDLCDKVAMGELGYGLSLPQIMNVCISKSKI
jgi:hypothetical protein